MRAALAIIAALAPGLALAGETDEAALDALLALEGDEAYGAYLAGECTACHASLSRATELPSLEDLTDGYIREQLHFYRAGTREHQVMNMLAARLGDEEIAALGTYLGVAEED